MINVFLNFIYSIICDYNQVAKDGSIDFIDE